MSPAEYIRKKYHYMSDSDAIFELDHLTVELQITLREAMDLVRKVLGRLQRQLTLSQFLLCCEDYFEHEN